jgi:Tfp pilus assembly protein PilP
MRRTNTIVKRVIILLIIALWVVGAQAQESQKTDIPKSKTSQEEPIYNPAGKRDPFKPFIKIIEQKEVKPGVSKSLPPLKRYSLEQFRLVGIVSVGQHPKAMIVDPEKNTYVLGVGDEIGNKDGKIVEVRDNGIMVEEKRYFEDVFGQKKVEIKKSILAFKEE